MVFDIPPCLCSQILHSIGKERLELVNSMEQYVVDRVIPLLKPVDKCWQPADFLPAAESPTFLEEVHPLPPLLPTPCSPL